MSQLAPQHGHGCKNTGFKETGVQVEGEHIVLTSVLTEWISSVSTNGDEAMSASRWKRGENLCVQPDVMPTWAGADKHLWPLRLQTTESFVLRIHSDCPIQDNNDVLVLHLYRVKGIYSSIFQCVVALSRKPQLSSAITTHIWLTLTK